MGRHTELVEDFIAAWHDRDIERIVAFLHPDIRYFSRTLRTARVEPGSRLRRSQRPAQLPMR